MERKVTRFECILEAKDPISHSSENIGNSAIFMRKKMRVRGGKIRMVPYITGDAMRHTMREAAVYATLEAAGMLSGDGPQLSRGALRLLFAGGAVTGKGDASTVNVDRYRELVALFPPLALFGGCTDNRPIPGQLIVDEGNVLCHETSSKAPSWVTQWLADHDEGLASYRAQVEEVQRVRMDPELIPGKLKLLNAAEHQEATNRALLSERAHTTGDAKDAKETKSKMMPRTHERLIQGTLFWWGCECRTYSELEEDAFKYIFGCLLSNFRVGGKLATGHGRLQLVAGAWGDMTPREQSMEPYALGKQIGSLYRDYIRENSGRLRDWLASEVNS